jgi:biopolymer transport protein ExbD
MAGTEARPTKICHRRYGYCRTVPKDPIVMWSHRKKTEESTLDMTPLVDVVFLLIIFFMLSTTFIVLPGIKVDLPKASSEKVTVEREEIVVSVDGQGAFYFNKDPIDDATMKARLRLAGTTNKDVQILLKGDAGCNYGRVVELLDMVRTCQLHRVAILTTRKKIDSKAQDGETR